MRLTKSFSIPDELERARANGELVIFAGAGVSISPPANLPSFLELAKQIAEPRVQCSPEYARALDRYLGRAAREGVDVQSRARHLLANGGKHTPLHENLLALFGDPQTVRLVTTNFDTHFATALSSGP
jgi:NAD-dependent SIR2 family protein deacetylase